MRKDGYNYIEDGNLPREGIVIWCDGPLQSGHGFFKNKIWYSLNKRPGGMFVPFKGEVTCWRSINLGEKA